MVQVGERVFALPTAGLEEGINDSRTEAGVGVTD